MGLRNLRETLSNNRKVFGTHKIGYTGAEIVTRTAAYTNDSGSGLLYAYATDPTARYSLRINSTTVGPYGMYVHEDGSLYVSEHGLIGYSVYKNNVRIASQTDG